MELHTYYRVVLSLSGMDEWSESKTGLWWDHGLDLKGKRIMCWVKSNASEWFVHLVDHKFSLYSAVLPLHIMEFLLPRSFKFIVNWNSILYLPRRYPIPSYFPSLEVLFLTIHKTDRWEGEHKLNGAPHCLQLPSIPHVTAMISFK